MVSLQQKMNATLKDYGLIADGDRVLIALSGGKDSLTLTDLLARRMKIFKPHFTLVAVHVVVDNVPYVSDREYLHHFCEQRGVPFECVRTHFEEQTTESKNICFLCSWYRRKALFETAKSLGCNKLALGHHRDDLLETLLMNMIFQGTIATMPPMLPMEKFPLTIIRPLARIAEDDIVAFAEEQGYKRMPKLCPHEHESQRTQVRHILEAMKRLAPDAVHSLWHSMENVKSTYLPQRVEKCSHKTS